MINPRFRAEYPNRLRRVTAFVVLEDRQVELELRTNIFVWATSTVADLHRRRW